MEPVTVKPRMEARLSSRQVLEDVWESDKRD